jgi:competence protein ComEC
VWLGAYVLGLLISQHELVSPRAGLYILPPLIILLISSAFSGRARLFFFLCLISAIGLGVAREGNERLKLRRGERLYEYAGEGKQRIIFRADRIPERYEGYTVFHGVVERIKQGEDWVVAAGRTRLAVGESVPGVYRGDRVLAMASFKRPRVFNNPGGFNYLEYLARRGIAVTGWVDSAMEIAHIRSDAWPGPLNLIDRARERYLIWLRRAPGRGGDLMRALLAGERESLAPEVVDAFRDTGLSHILAISGLHLALVSLIAFFAFEWPVRRMPQVIKRVPAQRVAALLTILVVVAYAVLTGMRLPTQRALVMVVTYLLAVAFDREREVWNALALAAVIILFIWPEALYEASFRLSFICVAGILYLTPRLTVAVYGVKTEAERELDRLELMLGAGGAGVFSRALKYLTALFLVGVVAQWSVFPMQVAFFHATNPLTPVYNLFAIPVCGLLLIPLGLAGSLVALAWPTGGGAILVAAASIAELLVAGLTFLAREMPAILLLPEFSPAGALAWYGGGILLLEAAVVVRSGSWSRRYFSPARRRAEILITAPKKIPRASKPQRLTAAALGLFLVFIALYDLARSRAPFPEGSFVTAAIDVGQGQSFLIRFPDEKNILVDGGGFYRSQWDVGKNIIAPCLISMGIRRLDAVALSHPHPDHGRGLAYVLSHFKVKEFWRGPDENELTERLVEICGKRGIRVRVLTRESPDIDLGDCSAAVLNPPGRATELADLNDRSLVLKIGGAGCSALLTGDVEEEAEHLLVRDYGPAGSIKPNALGARVMSVPHHGSKSSSSPELLSAIAPEAALVSAGGADYTGLPSPEVMGRYSDRGISVISTHQHGFTAVALDGNSVRLFKGPESIRY